MEKSVDLDQTAPDQTALFAYAILSDTLAYKILGHLLYCLLHIQCFLFVVFFSAISTNLGLFKF